MSMPPSRSSTSAKMRSMPSRVLLSAVKPDTSPSPPDAFASESSSSGWCRPKVSTRAPSSTSILTVARPIPVVPPVTRMRFPASAVWVAFMS
jgi:hypothetical protein